MSGKGKTIFVTGGAGYVGSHCVHELLKEDYDIVAIDNFSNSVKGSGPTPPSLKRIEEMTGKSVTFYEADLCNKEQLKGIMGKHKIDCVIHFGAFKSVSESFQNPLKYYTNNVVGSCNLTEVMNDLGIKKVVFSSSCTVYGDPHYLPVDEKHETGKFTNPYGLTKYVTEEMFKGCSVVDKDLGCIFLRYFNPVGAHPSGNIGEDPLGVPSNLMPFIAQVAVGRRPKLSVFGNDWETPDKTCVRDYIHVMDLAAGHVRAVDLILRDGGLSGVKAYNLATGKGESVLEVIAAFEKASGNPIPYEFAPRRPGDVAETYAACGLAERELGWKAKLNLDDMCRDMWTWQSKNPKGYLEG